MSFQSIWSRQSRFNRWGLLVLFLMLVSPTLYYAFNVVTRPSPMQFTWGTAAVPRKWLVVRSTPDSIVVSNPCFVVFIACGSKMAISFGARDAWPVRGVSREEFKSKLKIYEGPAYKDRELKTAAGEWICFERQGPADVNTDGITCGSYDHGVIANLGGDPKDYGSDFYEILQTIRVKPRPVVRQN